MGNLRQRRRPFIRRVAVPATALVIEAVLLVGVGDLVHNADIRANAQTTIATDALVPSNCADPALLETTDPVVVEHLYCTDGGFPTISEREASTVAGLATAKVHYVFTDENRPPWATGQYWAPEVHDLGSHAPSPFQRFVMLYCAEDSHGVHGIGLAFASEASGPWADSGIEQLRDPTHDTRHLGGSDRIIDPALLISRDGNMYLYWKLTAHARDEVTSIMGARVTIDVAGLTVQGTPRALIRADRPAEHGDVEAPSVVERNGRVILTYSGGGTTQPTYNVMGAVSARPLGPFTKTGVVLKQSRRWYGPGGATITTVQGRDFLVLHGYPAGSYRGARYPLLERVTFSGARTVAGPGSTVEPISRLDVGLIGPVPEAGGPAATVNVLPTRTGSGLSR